MIKLKLQFYRLEELVESEFIKEKCGHPVEGVKSVDTNHEDKPEPHSQIHFLIDDVLQKEIQSSLDEI